MERDARFEEMFNFDLNGIECHYNYLFSPDTKYESVWKCTLLLPDNLAAEMSKVGFNVTEREIAGETRKTIVAKRKTHTRDGKAMYPPKVFDAGTEDTPPSLWPTDVAVGNGSILNLKVSAIYRDVGGKISLPLYLNAVQVVKHVPYGDAPFKSVNSDNQAFGSV